MPTLRFLVFKQLLFQKFLAHWALFIPNREGSAQGVLFEVKKLKSKRTQFWHRDFNYLQEAKHLRANIPIPEIKIKTPDMNRVCHRVNKNRPFHLLNSNCQHWVFEVMERIIREKGITNGVEIFGRIEEAGYKPLRGYTYRLLEGDNEQRV
jgi:hypothetical protein